MTKTKTGACGRMFMEFKATVSPKVHALIEEAQAYAAVCNSTTAQAIRGTINLLAHAHAKILYLLSDPDPATATDPIVLKSAHLNPQMKDFNIFSYCVVLQGAMEDTMADLQKAIEHSQMEVV